MFSKNPTVEQWIYRNYLVAAIYFVVVGIAGYFFAEHISQGAMQGLLTVFAILVVASCIPRLLSDVNYKILVASCGIIPLTVGRAIALPAEQPMDDAATYMAAIGFFILFFGSLWHTRRRLAGKYDLTKKFGEQNS
jgi:uncharacterized membrane protein YfcA